MEPRPLFLFLQISVANDGSCIDAADAVISGGACADGLRA